jgi:hypothetical protein
VKYVQFNAGESLLSTFGLLLSSSPEHTEALVESIKWKNDGEGFLQLKTNDPQLLEASLWLTFSESAEKAMTSVIVNAKHVSGSWDTGYGVVFCYEDSSNFYRCLICTSGQYCVHKCVSGCWTAVIPWTAAPSANLKREFGSTDTIGIVRRGADSFDVVFNGVRETSFSDGAFKGGVSGFFASMSDEDSERFPEVPEDIRFCLETPLRLPSTEIR